MTHFAIGDAKYNADDKEYDEKSLQILYLYQKTHCFTVHKKEN